MVLGLADQLDEVRAVAFEPGRTDARNPGQFGQIARPAISDGVQGGVVEDDVRRQAMSPGELQSPGSQGDRKSVV